MSHEPHVLDSFTLYFEEIKPRPFRMPELSVGSRLADAAGAAYRAGASVVGRMWTVVNEVMEKL